jgi:hypothetical protein
MARFAKSWRRENERRPAREPAPAARQAGTEKISPLFTHHRCGGRAARPRSLMSAARRGSRRHPAHRSAGHTARGGRCRRPSPLPLMRGFVLWLRVDFRFRACAGAGAIARRHHLNPAEAHGRWRRERSEAIRLAVRDHHTHSLGAQSPAQSEQWRCWFGRRRIISGSAENRGSSCPSAIDPRPRKHHC